MNRVDGVILGVGVVVLVASIVGVVLYDDTAGSTFEVTWQQSDAQQLDEMEDSGAAGEYTFEVPVNDTGLATTTFTVDVTRNGLAQGDSFDVSVEGPDGATADCSADITGNQAGSGSCQAESDVQEAPAMESVQAQNASAAREMASQDLPTTGAGTWTVTVTIDGGTGLPGPGAASYTITVGPAYTVWSPTAQPPSPGVAGP